MCILGTEGVRGGFFSGEVAHKVFRAKPLVQPFCWRVLSLSATASAGWKTIWPSLDRQSFFCLSDWMKNVSFCHSKNLEKGKKIKSILSISERLSFIGIWHKHSSLGFCLLIVIKYFCLCPVWWLGQCSLLLKDGVGIMLMLYVSDYTHVSSWVLSLYKIYSIRQI